MTLITSVIVSQDDGLSYIKQTCPVDRVLLDLVESLTHQGALVVSWPFNLSQAMLGIIRIQFNAG